MYKEKKRQSRIDPELALNILRKVPDKAFLFFTDLDEYTGISAFSLDDFYNKLDKVPLRSVDFHFKRRDFQKWIRETLGDKQLAATINRTKKTMKGSEIRKTIRERVERRLTRLKAAKNRSIDR